MLNGHGDDLHLHNVLIKHNFSSNVYYKGCHKLLLQELNDSIGIIENYPSPIAEELNVLAAKKFNIHSNQFLFTNGATEAFYLIAQKYRSGKAIIVGPTFSEYEDACRVNQLKYNVVTHDYIKEIHKDIDLVFLCNPNNPDGSVLQVSEIENLLRKFSNTHFIIDEAYVEFSNKVQTVLPLLAHYTNLIVIRSLTKTFAIPGLRLGYIVSNSNFITELLAIKMPWSVNSIAIKAGNYIFENYENLLFDVKELVQETENFKKDLKQIDWLRIVPGTTSYFLIELKGKKASDLKQYLIEKYQILIRDATNFTGLKGEYIRLSTQAKTANDVLIEALKAWS